MANYPLNAINQSFKCYRRGFQLYKFLFAGQRCHNVGKLSSGIRRSQQVWYLQYILFCNANLFSLVFMKAHKTLHFWHCFRHPFKIKHAFLKSIASVLLRCVFYFDESVAIFRNKPENMTEGLELAKFQLKTLVTQVQKFMDMSPVFRLGPFWHATVEKASLFFLGRLCSLWKNLFDFVNFRVVY